MKRFSKKQEDFFDLIDENDNNSIKTEAPSLEPNHALTAEEVLSEKTDTSKRHDATGALDSLKKRMLKGQEKDDRTLLEKLKPFIIDEKGEDASANTAPAYTLDSVEDILNSDEQKTIDQLNHKYDISVDYLGKYIAEKSKNAKQEEVKPQPTPIKEETQEFEDNFEIGATVKNVQTSVPFVISDIDTVSSVTTKDERDISSTSTITFTPVMAEDKTKSKIVVTTQTKPIDLTGEFESFDNVEPDSFDSHTLLEKDDFDDYIPNYEIKNEKDNKKYIRIFSIKKRRNFIISCLSVIITLILSGMKLPFMSDLVLGQTFITMIVCAFLAFLTVILNCDMFLSLKNIFTKKSNQDILASLSSIFVIAYSVVGILKTQIILDLLITLCIVLSFRAIGKFRKNSYMLSNLKQITTIRDKNAVNLLSDPAVTFAMAKDSIEGDVLIATNQKCNQITDYIKYSTFGEFLNGKLPAITVTTLLFSIISGFIAASYFDGIYYGFYASAAILCFASLPFVFFVDNLALYHAAKRLNKNGSMIAGKWGAQVIEMSNGVVLNSTDLFPIGTVTLHKMQVLSENNLDETILRAASLTETLNSPLAPIFKRIAGESNIQNLPDSDTVKYEDRMGISGWVNDKLLFIGNRTLMEAHGITVPSIEVDRKILRNGYFPVYVASGDKACALLIVQYDVSPIVAKELRQLTKMGVTVLVSNTDPNITKEMICDYLGLYDDSVMLMTAAGCHMYRNTVTKEKTVSAPAAFRSTAISLVKIINCASKIRKSNNILIVFYIIAAILGIIVFAYASFNGSGTLIESSTVLLYSLISTIISYILYLTQKP